MTWPAPPVEESAVLPSLEVHAASLPLIVVPCYNEARRLDRRAMRAVAEGGRARLLLVNDGSRDDTGRVLATMAAAASGMEVVDLPANVGKGEAVRCGLRIAVNAGCSLVGYLDTDLATPPAELSG